MFEIEYLDHVALKVRDVDAAVSWYERILGLKQRPINGYEPYPIFMVRGQTGVALFPTETKRPGKLVTGDWLIVRHIAFRVTKDNFLQAQFHLKNNEVRYDVSQYAQYQSIFFRDLDGHRLELITPRES